MYKLIGFEQTPHNFSNIFIHALRIWCKLEPCYFSKEEFLESCVLLLQVFGIFFDVFPEFVLNSADKIFQAVIVLRKIRKNEITLKHDSLEEFSSMYSLNLNLILRTKYFKQQLFYGRLEKWNNNKTWFSGSDENLFL